MNIYAISLGCDKNRVDTENMLYLLQKSRHNITCDIAESDAILINTCGFIESAKKEAIDTIAEMLPFSADGRKLVVAGCMAQRYADELREGFPEIDAIVGVHSENEIVEIFNDLDEKGRIYKREEYREYIAGRVLTTPTHYAYLRIADGCNNHCTYCAIPMIRGRYRSVAMDLLIAEAKELVGRGVKELILVAQDTTRYGEDLYGQPRLAELLKELTKLPLWRVRILYAYPERIDDELISLIASEEKIAKYIDIPLQHINDGVLKRMNRKSSSEGIRTLIKKIKEENANIAVRTTFLVGFNGESEEAFLELKEFLTETDGIDYAGFFGFSVEEGTPAAKFKDGFVAKGVIKRRVKELEMLWSKRILDRHRSYEGKTVDVIYEDIDYKKKCFVGRIEQNAPSVDTRVFFTAEMPLDVGEVYKVFIEKTDFNLYGKVKGGSL